MCTGFPAQGTAEGSIRGTSRMEQPRTRLLSILLPPGAQGVTAIAGFSSDEQLVVPRHKFPGVLSLGAGDSWCQGTRKGEIKAGQVKPGEVQ